MKMLFLSGMFFYDLLVFVLLYYRLSVFSQGEVLLTLPTLTIDSYALTTRHRALATRCRPAWVLRLVSLV